MQELQQQLQQDFQVRLEPVLQEIGREKGLHFIFNGPDAGLVWADNALDISADVIKKLDAAKPAGNKPPVQWNAGIPRVLDRLRDRYPSLLVDQIEEHEAGSGSSPSRTSPSTRSSSRATTRARRCCPAVLTIEALTQVSTLLLLEQRAGHPARPRRVLRGVDNGPSSAARWCRATGCASRSRSARATVRWSASSGRPSSTARSSPKPNSCWWCGRVAAAIDPSAHVHPSAVIGDGTVGRPVRRRSGPQVVLGRECKVGASAVIDGNTTVGDGTAVLPVRLDRPPAPGPEVPGRATRGWSSASATSSASSSPSTAAPSAAADETTIGDDNLFMAYAHVAHDCRVGSLTIFGNAATLGGHVRVEDFATISAYSGVHQFCRVGRHAFIGGYSVVTKDALPFAKTVGNRARVYGLNTIGLIRRGFTEERVGQLEARLPLPARSRS